MMRFILCLLVLISAAGLVNPSFDKSEYFSDELLCINISKNIISKFEQEINSALDSAMKYSSLDIAFDNFSFDAQILSSFYEQENLFTLKRISNKPRNTDNEATSFEFYLLDQFDYSRNGSTSDIIIWSNFGTEYTFHYYEPITATEDCLTCHGNQIEIPDKIQRMIRKIYPDDEAVDYTSHDLRGMYVVKLNWPQAKDSLLALYNNF